MTNQYYFIWYQWDEDYQPQYVYVRGNTWEEARRNFIENFGEGYIFGCDRKTQLNSEAPLLWL